MSYNNTRATQIINRIPNVFNSNTLQVKRRAIVIEAEKRSRRNVLHAHARVIQVALNRFTALVYQTVDDESSTFINVDTYGKILVPVPWNWRNCATYGLNRSDADYLRWEMKGRSLPEMDHASVFYFDNGRWFLDTNLYPNEAAAFTYWHDYPITAKTLAGFAKIQKR